MGRRSRHRRRLRHIFLGAVSVAALALVSGTAGAQCNQSGTAATCSGNSGSTISFIDNPPGSPFAGTLPTSLTVQNLTAAVTGGIFYESIDGNSAATAAAGANGPGLGLTIASGVTAGNSGSAVNGVLVLGTAQAGGAGAGAADSTVIGGNGGTGSAVSLSNAGTISALGTFTTDDRAVLLGQQATLDSINTGITVSNLALNALNGTDTSATAINDENGLAASFSVDLSTSDGPATLQNDITGFLLPTLEPLQAYYSGFPLPEEPGHALNGALVAQSIGGAGGLGGIKLSGSGPTGTGGVGGVGGAINLINSGTLTTSGSFTAGILALSIGGVGGAHDAFDLNSQAGNGGSGGNVTVTDSGALTTSGISAPGVFAQSIGGAGASALISGAGGAGATVLVTESGTIVTSGYGAYGVFAQSAGGLGSNSEGSGDGGDGGAAGSATLNFSGKVSTQGVSAYGVFVSSLGGIGGDAASGGGGTGGGGGNSGAVSLTIASGADITTTGSGATAAYAESAGGVGGIGSTVNGFWASAGGGGNGGIGGNVTASNAGTLTTSGDYAYGLFGQATGGAGGVGGDAAGFVSFSGEGGGGAPAGNVTLGNSGVITTSGIGANALFAQSVGGAGGNGGAAGGFVALGSSGGSQAQAACEADVTKCLNGGIVIATNSGALHATGTGASGIFAESIGGGGGTGGASSGIFTYGGQGGAGGNGGAVTAANTGTVSIGGDDANAIFAQSVGGGGGAGGDATSGGTTVSLAIGGNGGAGGNGGLVTVTNAGSLAVNAFDTYGIFAQSVGGGGGVGGSATAASVGAIATAAVTIGGSGGDGGNGGALNISNSGSITTQGDFSNAVGVQSVGGGGGTGGSAFSFSASAGPQFAVSASVAVGGTGGNGGNGGAVTLANSGIILTQDWDAYGVFAQSVGGGGGAGGSSAAQSITASPGVTANIDVSVGGTGGSGGIGGAVQVINSGSVETFGMLSPGIFAQSVGGGGGTGGDASSTSAAFLSEESASVDVSVGGTGGSGGNGGLVKVTNVGSVTVLGDWSNGITAQSVGGGGGTGGAGSQGDFFDGLSPPTEAPDITDEDGNINIKDRAKAKLASLQTQFQNLKSDPKSFGKNLLSNELDDIKKGLTSKPTSFGVSIGVGGSGGTAGDGGEADVVNTGDVTTAGFMGFGIFAQSVGGGGGEGGGGNGASSSGDLNIGGGFGGGGGSAGNGGTVSVTNTGTINTFADFSYGIMAQSVGGGGGIGGTAGGTSSGARSLSLSIGGQGGSSGTGGDVSVAQNGDVVTFGLGSIGVLAQSVGGGGGIGGGATAANFLNVSVGGNGSGGGDGGNVQVTVNGNIATSGDSAYGVFAQSVGGGGGLASGVTTSNYVVGVDPFGLIQIPTGVAFALGNVGIGGGGGAGGNGGNITINTSGTITTTGVAAHGIFAQSVAGGGGVGGGGGSNLPLALTLAGSDGDAGNAGTIIINHNGNIQTFGANSDGILAQSISGNNSGGGGGGGTISLGGSSSPGGPALDGLGGNISISVNGVISGGPGSGVGIFINGGNKNSLTIGPNGDVTAQSGLAIVASEGDDVIDNSGTVSGSVGLGGGANSFLNRIGAVFEPGTAVYLGAGNVLTNQGTLSPFGAGAGTTQMVGKLTETATSTMLMDTDFSGKNNGDLIAVQGNATVAGLVVPRINVVTAVPGTVTTILTATQLTNNGISVNSTLVAAYSLNVSATSLQVGLNSINFVPAGANLTGMQNNIATYLQTIWQGGGESPEVGALLNYLATVNAPAAYGAVMTALDPTPIQSQLTAATLSSFAFTNGLMSCPGASTIEDSLQEHDCFWIREAGNWAGEGASTRSAGYRLTGPRLQGGWQKEIRQDLFLGLSAGWNRATAYAGSNLTIDRQEIDAGVVLKYQDLPWTYAAALSYAHGWSFNQRSLPLPNGALGATSDQTQDMVDAKLRASRLIRFDEDWLEDFYAKPSADFDLNFIDRGGFAEKGAGAFDVDAESSSGALLEATAGLEAGWLTPLHGQNFARLYLAASGTVLSRDHWNSVGHFEGAGPSTADFVLPGYFPSSFFRLTPGVEFNVGSGTVLVEYETRNAPHYHDNTASAKLEFRF